MGWIESKNLNAGCRCNSAEVMVLLCTCVRIVYIIIFTFESWHSHGPSRSPIGPLVHQPNGWSIMVENTKTSAAFANDVFMCVAERVWHVQHAHYSTLAYYHC